MNVHYVTLRVVDAEDLGLAAIHEALTDAKRLPFGITAEVTKPRVVVQHAEEEPTVVVEPEDSVEVELQDAWAATQLVFSYRGVNVYRTVRDGDVLSDYWLASQPHVSWESDFAFDVRDLSVDDLDDVTESRYTAEFEHYAGLLDEGEILALAHWIEQGWLTDDGIVRELV